MGAKFAASGGGGRFGADSGCGTSLMGEEIMDETDCEVPCPFIRLDARLAPGGGRGAARCGTSSEMGAVELGMVVMTGRLGSDLEG